MTTNPGEVLQESDVDGEAAGQNSRCRVTVVGDRRRVDLALPARAPIAEYVPNLLRWCGQLELDEVSPRAWSLALPGDAALPPSSTLADLGVADGATLYLRDATAGELDEPVITDVDDVAAEAVAPRWAWDQNARAAAMTHAGIVAVLAGLVALAVTGGARSEVPLVAVLAGLVLPLLAWLTAPPHRSAPAGVRAALAVSAVPSFALAGVCLVWPSGGAGPGLAPLAAGFGTMLGAAVTALALRHVLTVALWWAAMIALVVTGFGTGLGLPRGPLAALVMVLGLLVVRSAPWLAGRLLEVAGTRRAADPGPAQTPVEEDPTHPQLDVWAREGRVALLALRVAGAVAAASAAVVLAVSPGPFAPAMAACASTALLVRSGRGRGLSDAVPDVAAGVVGVIAVAAAGGRAWGLPAWLGPAVLVLVAFAAVGVGLSHASSGWSPARPPRGGNGWVVVLTAGALVCGFGVFGAFHALFALGAGL